MDLHDFPGLGKRLKIDPDANNSTNNIASKVTGSPTHSHSISDDNTGRQNSSSYNPVLPLNKLKASEEFEIKIERPDDSEFFNDTDFSQSGSEANQSEFSAGENEGQNDYAKVKVKPEVLNSILIQQVSSIQSPMKSTITTAHAGDGNEKAGGHVVPLGMFFNSAHFLNKTDRDRGSSSLSQEESFADDDMDGGCEQAMGEMCHNNELHSPESSGSSTCIKSTLLKPTNERSDNSASSSSQQSWAKAKAYTKPKLPLHALISVAIKNSQTGAVATSELCNFISMERTHTIDSHRQAVNALCRTCGRISLTHKEKRARQKAIPCWKYREDIFLIYNIDTALDEEGTHSEFICRSCYFNMRSAKSRNSSVSIRTAREKVENTKVIWCPYSDSDSSLCSVCQHLFNQRSGFLNNFKGRQSSTILLEKELDATSAIVTNTTPAISSSVAKEGFHSHTSQQQMCILDNPLTDNSRSRYAGTIIETELDINTAPTTTSSFVAKEGCLTSQQQQVCSMDNSLTYNRNSVIESGSLISNSGNTRRPTNYHSRCIEIGTQGDRMKVNYSDHDSATLSHSDKDRLCDNVAGMSNSDKAISLYQSPHQQSQSSSTSQPMSILLSLLMGTSSQSNQSTSVTTSTLMKRKHPPQMSDSRTTSQINMVKRTKHEH